MVMREQHGDEGTTMVMREQHGPGEWMRMTQATHFSLVASIADITLTRLR
jgi:hypothetical protein